MNNIQIVPAVLAGGGGTRLWPLSTPGRPKPFVPLPGTATLFEMTVTRAHRLASRPALAVACKELEPHCKREGVVFLQEPAPRNTAAAVALAAERAAADLGESAVLVILPSDHWIEGEEAFVRDVKALAALCSEEKALGVLGIVPSKPETGYGYIEEGQAAGAGRRVARFIEKPLADRAAEMVSAGRFRWNSGMFVLPVGVFREEMAVHAPSYLSAARAWLNEGSDGPYKALPPLSLDYAVMEKTSRAVVLAASFSWSDLGTFGALHAAMPKDPDGNAAWGPGTVANCKDCLIVTEDAATLVRDLAGMAFIQTAAGTLITPLTSSGEIRGDVERVLKSLK